MLKLFDGVKNQKLSKIKLEKINEKIKELQDADYSEKVACVGKELSLRGTCHFGSRNRKILKLEKKASRVRRAIYQTEKNRSR